MIRLTIHQEATLLGTVMNGPNLSIADLPDEVRGDIARESVAIVLEFLGKTLDLPDIDLVDQEWWHEFAEQLGKECGLVDPDEATAKAEAAEKELARLQKLIGQAHAELKDLGKPALAKKVPGRRIGHHGILDDMEER